jgi:hypothetical protein
MKTNLFILVIFMAVIALASVSCNKDDNSAVEWKTGTITTVDVSASAGEEVFEPVNGLTFSFPDGGSGSLEVAPVISGADPVFEECTGFLINYDGQTEIRFVVEDTSETAMLWGWGSNDGLMEDYTNAENMWVSIPFETLGGNKRSYMLVMPETSYLKNTKAVHGGFKYYIWLPQLSLYHQDKLAWLIEKKNLMHANYIGSLPPTIKENTLARVNSNYSRIFFVDAAYYDPWWNVLGKICLKTNINLASNVNDSTAHLASLAHEDGHYMLHMMLGDEIFGTIVSQLPNPVPDDHGVGDLRNRTDYYIEESAYFSEYFHTGIVSNTNSPEKLRTFLWSNTNMPDKVDYPSLEGFGVALLANLHQTDASALSVYMPEKYLVSVEVPVIGASFEDIFGIIARGSKNIDELRQHISDYLESKNQGDLLAPFLQRLGWGYQVKVRAVDADNKPLSGITARSVCQAGGKYWYGTTSYFASEEDGFLTIPEVFGGEDVLYEGTRLLRFYFGNDSVDVDKLDIDLDISWLNKTNEVIDLGDVTVDTTSGGGTFQIGQSYGGGIIIYIDNSGKHGLIGGAHLGGQEDWGCPGILIGTSTAVGTGQANTTAIVNGCFEPYNAANNCNNCIEGGYSDWYMPSIDELYLVYLNKSLIGIDWGVYLSSSESSESKVWGIIMNDGRLEEIDKDDTFNFLTAIRSF